jgi:fibronectin-binding autotransporter adhesin
MNKNNTSQQLALFMPYGMSQGGVFVAVGDVNNDGQDDVITGLTQGSAHVKAFSQNGTLLRSFDAFPGYTGGVRVASGDVNGDGYADIIVGTASGAAHVKIFSGYDGSLLRSFLAYSAGIAGGVFVAAGDVDGDGAAEIVTGAGAGAGPHIKIFNGNTLNVEASFFAYEATFTGGVSVATTDQDGDGRADIIAGAGPGAQPHVKVFDGETLGLLASFLAYDRTYTGGVHVAGQPVMTTPAGYPSLGVLKIFSDGRVQSIMPLPMYMGGLTVAASQGAMPKPRGRTSNVDVIDAPEAAPADQ